MAWPLVVKKPKKRKESKCTSPLTSFEVHTSSNLPSLVITSINKDGKFGSYFIHACRHIGNDECYYNSITITLACIRHVGMYV